MRKYIASYKTPDDRQASFLWIDAEDFVSASQKALDAIQEPYPLPDPPKVKTVMQRNNEFSDKETRRETDEFRDWKNERLAALRLNATRRFRLWKLQEFFAK